MKKYLNKQLSIVVFLYIDLISVGYTAGWTAPVIPKLQNPDESPVPMVTNGEASWIGSVGFLGALIGATIAGSLSNIKGRKPCLQLGGTIVMLAYLILALSVNLGMILVGRLLTGIGVSIMCSINMVYIAEIASTHVRGIFLTATGTFCVFGTLIVYTIGPYVSYPVTGYIGFLISMVFSIGTLYIPETPVFHVLNGQEIQAKDTLVQLGRIDDIEEVITTKLNSTESRKQEWLALFRSRNNRIALFVAATLVILQQASGAIAVIFFTTSIFQTASTYIDPNISTIITGVTQILASLITPLFIERTGRRILLIVSTAICSLSLASLGIYFYLGAFYNSASFALKWLPLSSLVILLLSYNIGFAVIPEALMGEMLESNFRGPGSALTITLGWLFGFTSITAHGYMMTTLGGYVTFWIYSIICATASIFTAIFVPETKGKSLVEIQYSINK